MATGAAKSSGGAALATDTPAALGTAAAGSASTASKSDHVHDMPALDTLDAPTDIATHNASTTAHGFAPKATAPAAGLLSVLAIGNGATVRSDTAIFDTTNPADLGVAAPGTALVAARRDHVHATPAMDINGLTNGTSVDPMIDRMPLYDGSAAGNRDVTPAIWWQKAAPVVDFRPMLTTAPYGWAFTGSPTLQAATSTTFSGLATVVGSGESIYLVDRAAILFGGCKWHLRMAFRTTADVTGDTSYWGFGDEATGVGVPVDGAFFRWLSGGTNIKAVTIANSVETGSSTDTGVPLAANTNYVMSIDINAAANSAVFTINDSVVATNTTNIPSGAGRFTSLMLGSSQGQCPIIIYRVTLWADDVLIG